MFYLAFPVVLSGRVGSSCLFRHDFEAEVLHPYFFDSFKNLKEK